jgi:hypothetical protein
VKPEQILNTDFQKILPVVDIPNSNGVIIENGVISIKAGMGGPFGSF